MTGNINSDNVVTASAYSNFLNAKVMSNVKKKSAIWLYIDLKKETLPF